MARFLIEIPHNENKVECARMIHVFMSSESHMLTNAEWGCLDGVHTAWLIVDVDSKEEALAIIPPVYRPDAIIVALNQFSLEQINEVLSRLEAEEAK